MAPTARGSRGREVLEIGANIGTTTVPLVTVLGAAHGHAFEPIPRNLELLERNVAGNGLGDRVTIHAAAVSDRAHANADQPAPPAFRSPAANRQR